SATAPGAAGLAHSAMSQAAPAPASSHRSRPRALLPATTISAAPAATSSTCAATDGPAREMSPRRRSTLAVTAQSRVATITHGSTPATDSRGRGYHHVGRGLTSYQRTAGLAHSRHQVHYCDGEARV